LSTAGVIGIRNANADSNSAVRCQSDRGCRVSRDIDRAALRSDDSCAIGIMVTLRNGDDARRSGDGINLLSDLRTQLFIGWFCRSRVSEGCDNRAGRDCSRDPPQGLWAHVTYFQSQSEELADGRQYRIVVLACAAAAVRWAPNRPVNRDRCVALDWWRLAALSPSQRLPTERPDRGCDRWMRRVDSRTTGGRTWRPSRS